VEKRLTDGANRVLYLDDYGEKVGNLGTLTLTNIYLWYDPPINISARPAEEKLGVLIDGTVVFLTYYNNFCSYLT